MPNEKGEAVGTHPEDKAGLFTLASTRLLSPLGSFQNQVTWILIPLQMSKLA